MNAALPALVVGTGFGCRIQIPALRAAGFNVVGLVGADAKRTAERAEANGVAESFTDLDQAIAKTKAVAVTIAAPPHTHAPLALTAIARGCHVLCEKPFAKDVGEARAMLKAAERAGVTHLIGHEFRYTPERALVARLIADGAIGTPRFVTSTGFSPYLVNPVDMPDWWFEGEEGGGWLGAAGSHLVDQLRSWLGDFESLSGALLTVAAPKDGAEDTYLFRFRTTKGVEGVVQQCAGTWGPAVDVTRVAGNNGSVWIEGADVHIADKDGARLVPPTPDLALPPVPPLGNDPRMKSTKWAWLVKVELPPYIRLCETWKAMIEGKGPSGAVKPATFADGVACMEVLDAIRQSTANGGALIKIAHGK